MAETVVTGDVDKRDDQLRGKRVYESVLSGRGGSKRWLLLNTGCHLLTVALSSSPLVPREVHSQNETFGSKTTSARAFSTKDRR